LAQNSRATISLQDDDTLHKHLASESRLKMMATVVARKETGSLLNVGGANSNFNSGPAGMAQSEQQEHVHLNYQSSAEEEDDLEVARVLDLDHPVAAGALMIHKGEGNNEEEEGEDDNEDDDDEDDETEELK
jgi:hypothetical protein